MTEISVRTLDVDEWERFRAIRLLALQESPEAFVATHESEAAEPETFWRERMQRATRLLAEVDGETVGTASIGQYEDHPEAAQLFGLWVAPDRRGSGVATALVRAGAKVAKDDGCRHLLYWVGTENGRAVAFASGFGFRPTSERRPMRVVSEADGEMEIAMTLPLEKDPGVFGARH